MKTLAKVPYEPVFVEFVPRQSEMEQGKVYISEEYKSSSHLCPCGCGELTVLPLNEIGDCWGWDLIK